METRHKVKSVRLKEEVVEMIDKMAKENNRTFSNMVETILLNFKPDEHQRLI